VSRRKESRQNKQWYSKQKEIKKEESEQKQVAGW
jgi:hypothetical protein